MTYPNITPVCVGRDGWSPLYTDEVSRLLFLCGLRPAENIVTRDRTTIGWVVSPKKVVRDGVRTPVVEGRVIKPTLQGVRAAMRALHRIKGPAPVGAILHRYGAMSIESLDKRWYGCVYDAAKTFLDA